MSSEENTNIVPVDKVNIENAAAATGGFVGLMLTGPLGAVILAALTSYVVKKDSDTGDALRGVGKTVVESYNYLTKLNGKYQITNKVSESVSKAIDARTEESESLGDFKKSVSTMNSKIKELNKEYDLVTKAKQAASAAAVVSDWAIEQVGKLNAEYDFVKIAKDSASKAIDFANEASAGKN